MPNRLSFVNYIFDPPLLTGRLLKRYKRFLAEVMLDHNEQTVLCHCPNSGSMLGLAQPGTPVALSHNLEAKRKTAYTWQLSKPDDHWVCINTALANKLALRAALQNCPPFFNDALTVQPEVKVSERSRLDLLVCKKDAKLYVEVKSVTLLQGRTAMFPDAVTTRGQKHLHELMRLKTSGHQALMLYLVQRQDAESFVPAAHIDAAYAKTLQTAIAAGVDVLVWQCKVGLTGITLWRQLPFHGHAEI